MSLEIVMNPRSQYSYATYLWKKKKEHLVSNQERSLLAISCQSQQVSLQGLIGTMMFKPSGQFWSHVIQTAHFSNSEMPNHVISVARGCLGSDSWVFPIDYVTMQFIYRVQGNEKSLWFNKTLNLSTLLYFNAEIKIQDKKAEEWVKLWTQTFVAK